MFTIINPRNNDWNRKYNFTDANGKGFFIQDKNGLSYFAWKFPDGSVKYYKCEAGVFEKGFEVSTDTLEYEPDPYENISFLRYPQEN